MADAIVSTWQEIELVLTPIIGQRGVTALYKRSLFLTSAAYSALAELHDGLLSAIDLAALKSELAQQSAAAAAAAGGAHLQKFYELLASLVGDSLSEQLLGSVWANTSSGPPAQETLP